jgi:hypothetical protein
MAASFWAWGLGPAGVMATAGVSIASVTAAVEAIAAAAGPWPIAAVLRAAAGYAAAGLFTQEERFAPAVVKFAATQWLLIPAERVPTQAAPQRLAPAAVVDRMQRQHIAAAVAVMPAAAVAVMPVVAVAVMPVVAVAVIDNR